MVTFFVLYNGGFWSLHPPLSSFFIPGFRILTPIVSGSYIPFIPYSSFSSLVVVAFLSLPHLALFSHECMAFRFYLSYRPIPPSLSSCHGCPSPTICVWLASVQCCIMTAYFFPLTYIPFSLNAGITPSPAISSILHNKCIMAVYFNVVGPFPTMSSFFQLMLHSLSLTVSQTKCAKRAT